MVPNPLTSLLVAIILLATSSSADFLQNGGGADTRRHPAVFVGFNRRTGIVQVVAMSRHFKEHSVPLHLRGKADAYFHEPTKFDHTMKKFLTKEETYIKGIKGELDFSKARKLNWENIWILTDPAVMEPVYFDKMMGVIST